MGATPPNYESEKSNGFATKDPSILKNQDLFPGARRINSPSNLDLTNTSRRHTTNRLMDTDIDILQHIPNTHRKIHPESILTSRDRPNISPLDRSERDQFVFDSHRKPQKKTKGGRHGASFSKRSHIQSDSDDDNVRSSARVNPRKGPGHQSGRKPSGQRNQSFSIVLDDTNNNIDDDQIEIDEIHLSDEDYEVAHSPQRDGVFSTFN